MAAAAGVSVANLVLLGLLHLDPLTEWTTELTLAMEDVPFHLQHRDPTMLARHAATETTLFLSE